MSDREDIPPSDETIAFSGRDVPPPTATAPIHLSGGEPPGGGRRVLVALVALLLGLAGGFAIAQLVHVGGEAKVPDEGLVLYESASTAFPIEGARFTSSTYDLQKGKCDKTLLKQFLRADKRRFDAWLDLQEITADEFDSFVDRLETRVLDKPTPVTNYGCFPDGEGPCPFAIQSVLGPGTPVWFDPQASRIVAKCTCSNPIRSPKCPPNCEEIPTPTPSPSPTPVPTTPPPTSPPPTASPTPTPSPSPIPSPTPIPTTPSPLPTP